MLPAEVIVTMRLSQVILFADDVARLRDFYAGLLGLRVMHEEPGWIRLDAGGAVLALHALRRAEGAPPPGPPVERTDGSIKVCFQADDLDAARSRLAAAGVAMREIHRYGDAAFCDGIDPEGNVFQLTTR